MLAFLAGWAILRVVAIVPGIGGLAWFLATVFGLGVLAVAARDAGREARALVPAGRSGRRPDPRAPAAPATAAGLMPRPVARAGCRRAVDRGEARRRPRAA